MPIWTFSKYRMQDYVLLAYLLGKLIQPQHMCRCLKQWRDFSRLQHHNHHIIIIERENFVVQFIRYFWCPSFVRPFDVMAQACFSVRKHLKTITQTYSDP